MIYYLAHPVLYSVTLFLALLSFAFGANMHASHSAAFHFPACFQNSYIR